MPSISDKRVSRAYTSPLTLPSLTKLSIDSVWAYACQPSVQAEQIDLANASDREDAIAMENVYTGETWTFAQVRQVSSYLAHKLVTMYSLSAGDRVLLCMPTSPQMILIFLACQFAGIIPASCNDSYTSFELAHCIKVVDPKVAITVSSIASRFEEAYAAMKDKLILVDSNSTSFWQPGQAGTPAPIKDADQTCMLAFTSGTSGLPKVAKIPMMGFIRALITIVKSTNIFSQGQARVLLCLPCFHASGLVQCIAGLLAGCHTIFCINKPFDMGAIIRTCAIKQITALALVPALVNGLILSGAAKSGAFSHLRYIGVGAAPLGPELEARVRSEFSQCTFITAYGMTETVSPVTISTSEDPLRLVGSVGRVAPGCLVILLDDDGKIVEEGEQGEVCVKHPSVTKGYFGNEAATLQLIDEEGWLHTGDVGRMGPHGNLFIVDRKKDLIKCKGFQVAPAELEDVLLSHPAVREAGVVGIESGKSEGDEWPRAYVSLKAGSDKKGIEDELMKFVSERVTHYKHLRGGVAVLDVLPRNGSGKLLRHELRSKKALAAVA